MIESTYTVTGMTCGHCAMAVEKELKTLDGVSEVKVDVASGRVDVSSMHPLETASVAAAIEEAGYQLVGSEGA